MNPLWTKTADYAHRYTGPHFQALAFHTQHHHPDGLLPPLPGPQHHGWALLGDFDATPVTGQGRFRSLKYALAYADTMFQDLQDNMARTGKTPDEVREAIAAIRRENDESHIRKLYRQKLGTDQKPTKTELAILLPTSP